MLILGFFRNLRLTNKSGKDHFKAFDLWIDFLALVSLWLLVNSTKKEKSQRKTSNWFFIYFTKRYFFYYYIIILPRFGFKRGYGMTEQLDFILTEIKRCYNTNDRYKFILFFIRRENDLNKWLKHVKRGYRKQMK